MSSPLGRLCSGSCVLSPVGYAVLPFRLRESVCFCGLIGQLGARGARWGEHYLSGLVCRASNPAVGRPIAVPVRLIIAKVASQLRSNHSRLAKRSASSRETHAVRLRRSLGMPLFLFGFGLDDGGDKNAKHAPTNIPRQLS